MRIKLAIATVAVISAASMAMGAMLATYHKSGKVDTTVQYCELDKSGIGYWCSKTPIVWNPTQANQDQSEHSFFGDK
jgi:hypothetical protein